jgi:hypothetical protein
MLINYFDQDFLERMRLAVFLDAKAEMRTTL